MFIPSKKLLSLLALLPPTALAARDASVTKTFKFKEDLFIKFHPLRTAIGPNESEKVLMAALNDIRREFKNTWIDQIETSLQGGDCTVDQMRLPEFSMCDWKYPDRYDVDELPTPGQCYDYEDGFIQRIYYEINELEITCLQDFSYDELDKDAYTEAVFSGQNFLNIINPGSNCDGDESTACLFSGAETAEWSTFSECTAELYINRFVDVPVYLKCLSTDGYGRSIANRLITALDKYFEEVVSVVLAEKILEQAPKGSIYNFASPYASDRKYCAHGAYYAGGNLVKQVPDQDGILITQFTYGFDVIWYKPIDFDDELLRNLEYIINDAFNDGDFLRFLGVEYPNYDFIQDDDICDVIDPGEVTFAPTEAPTGQPSEGPICDVDTDEGCSPGQVCRLSCVQRSNEPQCFDDEEERDCTEMYGLGYICKDSNEDGIITASDNLDGCQYVSPTASPSKLPTLSPTSGTPTISPSTDSPTISPSLRPVTLSPTISNPPSDFIEPTLSPSHTSRPSSEPTPIPSTPYPSTPRPTYYPSISSTSGDTETANTNKTLSPTPQQVFPVETLIPTASPMGDSSPSTPSPTCPLCIIHPIDTEEDDCPIVTIGTCGNGDRGDGICPFAGYCCSKWGYCGCTSDYCDDDSVAPSPSEVEGAPPAPTYSVDAGQCASGDVGDGFCPDESLCCSDWGYCGSGESYCFTTRTYNEDTGEGNDGTCGGGGVGDGACSSGLCCSRFGFCGEGELYCTGQNGICTDDAVVDEAEQIINSSPLPLDLKPEMGFRCGVTEVDARSNCKSECTHHVQCSNGDECWGVQLNYCNAFEESGAEHPICTDLDLADNDSRCGYDEASARGYCGPKCDSDDDCAVQGELCFPTLLNLCECHGERCPEAYVTYSFAKELISPYFVESDPASTAEGKPRNASFKMNLTVTASLLVVFAMNALVAML